MGRGANKTGEKGVKFHAQSGRYMAVIMARGHRTLLGYFDTAQEAGAAYASAKESLKNDHSPLSINRRVLWYQAYNANKVDARKAGVTVEPRAVGPNDAFDDYEFYGGHLGIRPPKWKDGQKRCGGRRMIVTPDGERLERIDMVFDDQGRFAGYDDNVLHDIWAKHGVGPKAVNDLV